MHQGGNYNRQQNRFSNFNPRERGRFPAPASEQPNTYDRCVTSKNYLTDLLLEEGAGRCNANAFINVNERFIANQWQHSKWSWFPLYWNINEIDISNFFLFFFFGDMHNYSFLVFSRYLCCHHMVARECRIPLI